VEGSESAEVIIEGVIDRRLGEFCAWRLAMPRTIFLDPERQGLPGFVPPARMEFLASSARHRLG
jgi:hypothetical protein